MTQLRHAVNIWLKGSFFLHAIAQSHKIHHLMTQHAHKKLQTALLIYYRKWYSSALLSYWKKDYYYLFYFFNHTSWWNTDTNIGDARF